MTRYNATLVSVRSSKPSYSFGRTALVPLQNAAKEGLIRVPLPADIPEDAIVTKAELVLTAGTSWAASRTIQVQRNAARFGLQYTWSDRPAVTGTTASVAVPAATANKTTFRIPVVSDAQDWIAGVTDNFGWRLTTTSGASDVSVRGSSAAAGVPWLDLEYLEVGMPPVNLSPAGVISTGNPTMTFIAPPGTTAIQVQVATDEDFTAIVHDSGTVVTSAGVYPLTAYTVADLATVYWRAQALTPSGWSGWSAVADFTRDDLPVPTITSPGATAGDVTPPLTWTAPGQTAWQARYYDVLTDALIDDSGYTAGAATSWTPTKGLKKAGRRGRFVLDVHDGVAGRVATPGAPTFATVSHEFDVVAAGSAPGPVNLTALQRGATAIIDLSWAIGETEPDEWLVLRNEEWIGRVDGSVTAFADLTAPPYHEHEYQVVALSGGEASTIGPIITVTPRPDGMWIIDPDDESMAAILGDEQGSQAMAEQAAVHPVVGRAPVRRRLGVLPPSGAQAGVLIEALGVTADESYDALMRWKTQDAGHVYRLVLGSWNVPVTLSDIVAAPTPISGEERIYAASFGWQQIDDELPWDAA